MVVLVRPSCDVNPPRLSPHLDANNFLMPHLSSNHYQLSNPPSLVSVRATKFTMPQNALSWCRYTSHNTGDVTSPDLWVIHMVKEYVSGQIWNVLTSSFPTRHRSSLYEQQNAQYHKNALSWCRCTSQIAGDVTPPTPTFGLSRYKKNF